MIVDPFCRDALPPRELWPEMRYDTLPELAAYPEHLNCAVELLDGAVARGWRERTALIMPDARWTYGELLETAPPYRSVTVERMIGMPGDGLRNELTLTPVSGGTLLAVVITFPDATTRDAVLATGMTDGMETSYARLETEVLA